MQGGGQLVRVARVEKPGQPPRWIHGAAAALTSYGGLTHQLGDPESVVVPLFSAIAPLQALPLLQEKGEERFDLELSDIALLTGSHAGDAAAVSRLSELLARGGFEASQLGCPARPPADPAAAQALAEAGETPGPIHHPASGNHVALLLGCRLQGLPAEGYLQPDHPMRLEMLDRLSAFCGIPKRLFGYRSEGEGGATFLAPLRAASRIYSALCDPFRAALTDPVATQVGRLLESWVAYPTVAGGSDPLTPRLAEATQGRVVGKASEKGFYGVAVRGPDFRGVGLWIEEGGEECRDGVVVEALRRLGALTESEYRALANLPRQELGDGGAVVVDPEDWTT